jgi:hypothetical protein
MNRSIDRLDQLRRLLDRLERMPASVDRDWMSGRSPRTGGRRGDGIAPAPLRALPQDELDAEMARRAISATRAGEDPPQEGEPAPARGDARATRRDAYPAGRRSRAAEHEDGRGPAPAGRRDVPGRRAGPRDRASTLESSGLRR